MLSTNNITISLKEVLISYDIPQVILLSKNGIDYLAIFIDTDGNNDNYYFGNYISKEDIQKLKNSEIDVRGIFEQNTDREWYIFVEYTFYCYTMDLVDLETLKHPLKDFFPDYGLYINKR